MERPLIVFDVNETLLDLQHVTPILGRIFGDEGVTQLWFANLVLYSCALTLADHYGPYGHFGGLYMKGPFQHGTKEQGPQSDVTHAEHYRKSVAALDAQQAFGKNFAALPDTQKDAVIKELEDDKLKLAEGSGQDFFKQILNDTHTGFFADPIYGGNKDMASWKMIGFPGAHYDYREWVDRHNQPVTLARVSIKAHPNASR
jgi:gluconate 2-dehydrogenase gamma chain